MSDVKDAEDEEAARRVARAYVQAASDEDFELAGTYLSRGGRAIVLATALGQGLRTDSCGAALAQLMKQQASVNQSARDAAREGVGGLVWEIRRTGADRATAVIDPSSIPNGLRRAPALEALPLVREDGEWKVGVTGVDDRPETRSPGSGAPELPQFENAELERFSVRVGELLLRDGWVVDGHGPGVDGKVFFGSFAMPTLPGFEATVEFILEGVLPESSALGSNRFHAVVGGEFGVRHLQTAERLRALGLGCDSNISLDIEEVFEEQGLALPEIADQRTADDAAAILADAVNRYGLPFAREHSTLDAMIRFVQDGGQTMRHETFEAMFVPVAMSASGRTADAAEAIDRYRSQMSRDDDRREYEAFIARFGS